MIEELKELPQSDLKSQEKVDDLGTTAPLYNDGILPWSRTEPGDEWNRRGPMTIMHWDKLFDREGRLQNVQSFLRSVFHCDGICADLRQQVWPYLFKVFPYNSTRKERGVIVRLKEFRFKAFVQRWQQVIVANFPNFTLENADAVPDYCCNQRWHERDCACATVSTECLSSDAPPLPLEHLTAHPLDLEAQIIAYRIRCSLGLLIQSITAVSKDIYRTEKMDRFERTEDCFYLALRDGLVTLSVLQPQIGYVQGMNDLLTRFLYVFKSQSLAFWCFHNYIVMIAECFRPDELLVRIGLIQRLLDAVDPVLFQFFLRNNMKDMPFCHKWLLLGFQREFPVEEGLRLLEVLFVARAQGVVLDLFVALAILHLLRQRILLCVDGSQILQILSDICGLLSVNEVLLETERLFQKHNNVHLNNG